ncbi:MAG TPA: ABC transporter permease [Amaricoccus sp.]|nr:ABC transporter permease [Amaricoccus sp.]
MAKTISAGNGMAAAAMPPPPRTGRPRLQRLRVIAALALRGMGTSNGRSAGGYLWAVLQPLGTTLLLALAFSMMLKSPPLGTSFILFYATGTIPFRLYGSMSNAVAGAINANRGLLAYPVVNPLDAVFAQCILEFMTTAMVAAAVFAGIGLFTDASITLDLAPVAGAFILAALLGLGVGTVNCVLFGFFPTWKNVWSVLSRPLFLMSGILYLYDSIPTALQAILWWNPMLQVVGMMRSGFFGSYEAEYVSMPYVLVIAGVLFVVGSWLIRRHASFLIEQ